MLAYLKTPSPSPESTSIVFVTPLTESLKYNLDPFSGLELKKIEHEQAPGAEQIKLKSLVGHCLLSPAPGQASSRTPTFQLLLCLRGSGLILVSRIRVINFGRKAD